MCHELYIESRTLWGASLRKDTWPHQKKPSSQHHASYECHELHTELQALHMNDAHLSTQSYSTPQNKVVIPAARLYESRTLLCDTNPSYEWGAPLYAKLLDPTKQSRHTSDAFLWVTNSTLSHEPSVWMRRLSTQSYLTPQNKVVIPQRRASDESRTLHWVTNPTYKQDAFLRKTKSSYHSDAPLIRHKLFIESRTLRINRTLHYTKIPGYGKQRHHPNGAPLQMRRLSSDESQTRTSHQLHAWTTHTDNCLQIYICICRYIHIYIYVYIHIYIYIRENDVVTPAAHLSKCAACPQMNHRLLPVMTSTHEYEATLTYEWHIRHLVTKDDIVIPAALHSKRAASEQRIATEHGVFLLRLIARFVLVSGVGFRLQCLGFRVYGLGIKV